MKPPAKDGEKTEKILSRFDELLISLARILLMTPHGLRPTAGELLVHIISPRTPGTHGQLARG